MALKSLITELIAIVRHMRAYPADELNDALRNVFDFDAFRPDTMDKLADILRHHGRAFLLPPDHLTG